MNKTRVQMLALVLLMVGLIAVFSIFFGVYGFLGTWIGFGTLALILLLVNSGRPWGIFDSGGVVLAGPFTLFMIVDSVYWMNKKAARCQPS